MIAISYQRYARCSVAPILICAGLLYHAPRGEAAPARFWISLSGNTIGPEVPTLNLPQGGRRTINVWGRPATDGANFKNLLNLSLNLVPSASSTAVYNIVDSFQVFNPGNRFEIVRDSSSPVNSPITSTGSPESVRGLTAAVAQTNLFTGIGLDDGDSSCSVGCEPSWLIASFEIEGIASSGSARLHLQIGSLGINHAGELSDMTEVVFGNDPLSVSYNGKNNREQTFPNADEPSLIDSPDLILNSIPFLAGDFDGDGDVDGRDFLIWQRGGSPNPLSGGDLADWQGNYGTPVISDVSQISGVTVPEPFSLGFCLLSLAAGLMSRQIRPA